MRSSRRHALAVTALVIGDIAAGACGAMQPEEGGGAGRDRWIALFPADAEHRLREVAIPIWDREEGVVITGASSAQLEVLRDRGLGPTFAAPDHGEGVHVLSYDRFFTPPDLPGVPRASINEQAMLYLLPAGQELELPRLKLHGLFHGVPRIPLPPSTSLRSKGHRMSFGR